MAVQNDADSLSESDKGQNSNYARIMKSIKIVKSLEAAQIHFRSGRSGADVSAYDLRKNHKLNLLAIESTKAAGSWIDCL